MKLNLIDFNFGGEGVTAFRQLSRTLDGMLHIKIRNDSSSNPQNLNPLSNPGEAFLVNSGGSGGWNGAVAKDIVIAKETVDPTDITTWDSPSDWTFITPTDGMIIWFRQRLNYYIFDGTDWIKPVAVALTTSLNLAQTTTEFNLLLANLRKFGVIAP